MRTTGALVIALAGLAFYARPGEAAPPAFLDPVAAAHEATLRLDVDGARAALAKASDSDANATLERALLALYVGDCDAAVAFTGRPAMPHDDYATHVADVARGCARVTAGTRTIVDQARGVSVRMNDDEDESFVPLLIDVADRGRAVLEREIGVSLPRPLRIELVRDHYGLAAMTGLPEEAAQTTGTVAVAKWGRVTMLSPRAAPHGYPWADTMMHEMTHLTVTRASGDRAPLWLQEGVAKREETRWRPPFLFDDRPSADGIAAFGFAHGQALALDKLGPSIAMLPSAEQAMIAFSEVTSFVRYWVREEGEPALPALLSRIATTEGPDAVNVALREVSGADLHGWSDRWRTAVEQAPPLPADQIPGADPPARREITRAVRLGTLLADRHHEAEATPYLERAQSLAPTEPSLRVRLARVYRATGHDTEADRKVDSLGALRHADGEFLALYASSLRARGDGGAADEAFERALWLDPLSLDVACQASDADHPLHDPLRAALCEAVRRASRD